MSGDVVAGGNSETWNNYYPVNSTVYSPSNIIRLRIPKSVFVADFSRAFLTLRINLPYSGDLTQYSSGSQTYWSVMDTPDTFSTNPTAGAARNGIPAILNAATLFDIVDLSINGQALYHDDFAQTSARINSLNKSDEWIEAHQQSFLDPMRKHIADNSQLAFKALTFPPNYTEGAVLISQKNVVIPLTSLFPCFEHISDWPCFAVSDTLEFNLYVSRLYKYFVDLNWMEKGDSERVSHYAVRGVEAEDMFKYNYVGEESDDSGHPTPKGVITFYPEDFTIDNVMLMLPGHSPSETEYARIEAVINSPTGYMYTFKHWDVVNYLSRYYNTDGPNLTQQVNFNVTANNIFGVSMLALKPNTEVVFEKPYYNSIQVNLGPWELAANGTHLGDNYTEGGDMLQSVLNNFSQTSLEYYQTVAKQVLYDHSIRYEEAFNVKTYHPTGAYLTYWDASPYDELGVGGNEFSNLITYKYSLSPFGVQASEWPVSNTGLGNAKTYCCIHTMSGISINAGGVQAINPNSMNLSTTFIQNLYNYEGDYTFRGAHGLVNGMTSHGVLGAVVGFIPKIFQGIGKGIRWIRDKIRARLHKKHFAYYRKHLTEEEINKNIDKLTHDSYYLFKKDWKRTFKEIIAARDKAHGLFVRHGLLEKLRDISPLRRVGAKVYSWEGRMRPRFTNGRLLHWTPFVNLNVKHGLCSTSHGIGSWFRKIFRRGKDHVIKITRDVLDRGKNIIQSLIAGKITKEEAIAAAKKYAKETGEDIMGEVYATIRGGGGSHGLILPEKFGRKRMLYNIFRRYPGRLDIAKPKWVDQLYPYGVIGKRAPMYLGS